jgi:hypothetical protein
MDIPSIARIDRVAVDGSSFFALEKRSSKLRKNLGGRLARRRWTADLVDAGSKSFVKLTRDPSGAYSIMRRQ